MTLDAALLALLACPQDRGPLWYFRDDAFLYNPRLRLRYEVTEGVPVLLVNEATTVSAGEHEALVARAPQT